MYFPQIAAPVLEVLIIAMIINYLLSFFWNTKSMDLIWGLLIFLSIFAISSLLKFPILNKVMVLLGNAAVVAVVIIFQPELRLALSKLSFKGRRYKEVTEFDKFLDHLANSTYRLAEKRVGALIVLEKEDSLDEYALKAVLLDANFSSELLETIFAISTPLHDGAVIIRNGKVVAASVILPLAEDSSQLTKSMGTRHRAGLGLSHITDALIIVVSEETGKVALAREGIMTRGIKIDRFKSVIRSIFTPPNKIAFQRKFNLRDWLKK